MRHFSLMTRRIITSMALCTVLALPHMARAQAVPAGYEVDYAIDGAITGGAAAGTLLMSLVPVDTTRRWDSEIFGALDLRVRDNFSSSAAKLSDALVASTALAPVLLQLDRGLDEQAGQRLLLYGEALSLSLFTNSVVKYTVQRPRPYNYFPDERVMAYAKAAGKDSHVSFYSGHASFSFTAAVTGSYLFALGSTDNKTKALVWMLELTLASATSNLRVRAGKHYYSDILIGAVAGTLIGFAVPALHADEGGVYEPSGLEWAAMAGGVVLGSVVSQLLPIENDIMVPLGKESRAIQSMQIIPIAHQDGAGLALVGELF